MRIFLEYKICIKKQQGIYSIGWKWQKNDNFQKVKHEKHNSLSMSFDIDQQYFQFKETENLLKLKIAEINKK